MATGVIDFDPNGLDFEYETDKLDKSFNKTNKKDTRKPSDFPVKDIVNHYNALKYSNLRSKYNIGKLEQGPSIFEWNPEWDTAPESIGGMDSASINYWEDARANDQSGFTKILNGALKGITTTGTTFVNTTAGLVAGTINSIATGTFQGFWDNPVTRTMKKIDDRMESLLPNYYTRQEQEDPWYQHIFSANSIGDKFLKNFGFTFGSMLGVKAMSKGMRLVPSLMKELKTASKGINAGIRAERMTNAIEASIIGAAGEASFEALTNSSDNDKALKQADQLWYNMQHSQLRQRYEAQYQEMVNEFGEEYAEAHLNDLRQSFYKDVNALDQEMKKRDAARAKAYAKYGNTDWLANVAILTLTNLGNYRNLLEGGFGDARGSLGKWIEGDLSRTNLRNAGRTIEKPHTKFTRKGFVTETQPVTQNVYRSTLSKGTNAARFLGSSLIEGVEEISQLWASNTSKQYVNDYYRMSIDPDETEKNVSYWKAMIDQLGATLRNPNSWEEFTIGFLSGGVSKAIMGETKMLKQERQDVNDAVTHLNNIFNNFSMRSAFQAMNRNSFLEDEKIQAAILGDKKAFKDAEFARLASAVTHLGEVDRLDDMKAVIDYVFDEQLTDDELEAMATNLSQIDEKTGEERNAFAKMTNDERRKHIKKQRKKYEELISNYAQAREDISRLTGGTFSTEKMSELVYNRLLAKNAVERVNQIREEQKNLFENIKFGASYNGKDFNDIIEDLTQSFNDVVDRYSFLSDMKKNLIEKLHKNVFSSRQELIQAIMDYEKTDEIERHKKKHGKNDKDWYADFFRSKDALNEFADEIWFYKDEIKNELAKNKSSIDTIKDIVKQLNTLNEELKLIKTHTQAVRSGRDTLESQFNEVKSKLSQIYDSMYNLSELTAKRLTSPNYSSFAQDAFALMATQNYFSVLMKNLGVEITNPAFQSFGKDSMDIMKLLADVEQYNKVLIDALNNPERLEEKRKSIKDKVHNWRKKLEAQKIVKKFDDIETYEQFKSLIDSVDEELKSELLKELSENEKFDSFIQRYKTIEEKVKSINVILDTQRNAESMALSQLPESVYEFSKEMVRATCDNAYSEDADEYDKNILKALDGFDSAIKLKFRDSGELTDEMNEEIIPSFVEQLKKGIELSKNDNKKSKKDNKDDEGDIDVLKHGSETDEDEDEDEDENDDKNENAEKTVEEAFEELLSSAKKSEKLKDNLNKLKEMSNEEIDKSSISTWDIGGVDSNILDFIFYTTGYNDTDIENNSEAEQKYTEKLKELKKLLQNINLDNIEENDENESDDEDMSVSYDDATVFKSDESDESSESVDENNKQEKSDENAEDETFTDEETGETINEFEVVNYSQSKNNSKARDNDYAATLQHVTKHDAINVNTTSSAYDYAALNPAHKDNNNRGRQLSLKENRKTEESKYSTLVRFNSQKFIDSGELQNVLKIYNDKGLSPKVYFTWNTTEGKNKSTINNNEVLVLIELPNEYKLPKEYNYSYTNSKGKTNVYEGVSLNNPVDGQPIQLEGKPARFMPIGTWSIRKNDPQYKIQEAIKKNQVTTDEKGNVHKKGVYTAFVNENGSLLWSNLEYVFPGRLVTSIKGVNGMEDKPYKEERTLVKVEKNGDYTSEVLNEEELQQVKDGKTPFSFVVSLNGKYINLTGRSVTDVVSLNSNFDRSGLQTHDGSLWIAVEEADGKKYLKAVHLRKFTSEWWSSHKEDTPYRKKLESVFNAIKSATNEAQFKSAVVDLKRFVRIPNKRRLLTYNAKNNSVTLYRYSPTGEQSNQETKDISKLETKDLINLIESNGLRFNISLKSPKKGGAAFVTEQDVLMSDIVTTDLAMLRNANASALISRFNDNMQPQQSNVAQSLRMGFDDNGNPFLHLETDSVGWKKWTYRDFNNHAVFQLRFNGATATCFINKSKGNKETWEEVKDKNKVYEYLVLFLDKMAGEETSNLRSETSKRILTGFDISANKYTRVAFGYKGSIYKFQHSELNNNEFVYFYFDSNNRPVEFTKKTGLSEAKAFIDLFSKSGRYEKKRKSFDALRSKHKELFSRAKRVPSENLLYLNKHYFQNIGQYYGTIGKKGYPIGEGIEQILHEEFDIFAKFVDNVSDVDKLIDGIKKALKTDESKRSKKQNDLLKNIADSFGVNVENLKISNDKLILGDPYFAGKMDIASMKKDFIDMLEKMIDNKKYDSSRLIELKEVVSKAKGFDDISNAKINLSYILNGKPLKRQPSNIQSNTDSERKTPKQNPSKVQQTPPQTPPTIISSQNSNPTGTQSKKGRKIGTQKIAANNYNQVDDILSLLKNNLDEKIINDYNDKSLEKISKALLLYGRDYLSNDTLKTTVMQKVNDYLKSIDVIRQSDGLDSATELIINEIKKKENSKIWCG